MGVDPEGASYTWMDVFIETFLDTAQTFSSTAAWSQAAMLDAGASEVRGLELPQKESWGAWISKYDSQAGAARILGFGSSAQITPELPIDACGGSSFADKLKPDTLAVCPSITGNLGVNRAIGLARAFATSPVPGAYSEVSFTDPLFAAAKEDAENAGVSTAEWTKSRWMESVGITEADASLARAYLCAEATVHGKIFKPVGTNSVQRFSGVQKSPPLPVPVLAAHIVGDPATTGAYSVLDDDYASGGVIRALDSMKVTSAALLADFLETPTQPKGWLVDGLDQLVDSIDAEVGSQRLEMLVKAGSVTDTVNVRLIIHNPTAGVTYLAVHGLEAMKCVATGSIESAPCEPADYAFDMTANGTGVPKDPEMEDIPNGLPSTSISVDLSSIPQPGNAQSPITAHDAIYIIEKRSPDDREVVVGAVPRPGVGGLGDYPPPSGPLLPDGYTRRIILPFGGSMQSAIADVLRPSDDDCSIPATTCAGLPANLWPPLESEINGQQSDAPYERSWQFFLETARATANEADLRGDDLIAQGLRMDEYAQKADDEVLAYCGAEADATTGCTPPETVDWVTLGDKPVCLWRASANLPLCACPNGEDPCPVPCPLPKDEDTDCSAAVGAAFSAAGFTAASQTIAVKEPLNLVATDPGGGKPGACEAFTKLRDQDVKDQERYVLIRTLFDDYDQATVVSIAEGLRYVEDFGDNYRLYYNDRPVFDTNRQGGRPSSNDLAMRPCKDVKTDTGSAFWEATIPCFVSGLSCPPTEQDDPNGVGLDGCPDDDRAINGGAYLSMDTEPAALRNRWAWGFGHLRRATAVLGVITRTLSGRMELPLIANHAGALTLAPGTPAVLYETPWAGGRTCVSGLGGAQTPSWLMNCVPFEQESLRPRTTCVWPSVSAQGVPPSDPFRALSGRPVSFNRFLPNRVPSFDSSIDPTQACPSEASPWLRDFPWVQFEGQWHLGVDPQMIYCSMPFPSNLIGSPPETWGTDVRGFWEDFGISSGWVGSSYTGTAEVVAENEAWAEALRAMWKVPADVGALCNDGSNDLTSAVWRAFCQAPKDHNLSSLLLDDRFVHEGVMPGQPTEYASGLAVGSWLLPLPNPGGLYAQYLFDLRDREHLAFQYPLTDRSIFDAMELACFAANGAPATMPACDQLPENYVPAEEHAAEEIQHILRCHLNRARRAASTAVFSGLPQPVVTAFRKGQPISTTSGYGGQYLDLMVEQYNGLDGIRRDLTAIGDSVQRVSKLGRDLQLISKKHELDSQALSYSKLAAHLNAWAGVMSSLSQAAQFDFNTGVPTAHAGHFAAAELQRQADNAQQMAFSFQSQAGDVQWLIDMAAVLQAMVDEMAASKGIADNVILHVNQLSNAAAKMKLLDKQVKRSVARSAFADYAGDPGQDPQFFNTAMRRVYNTKLIRYEQALDRAKKAAFIARRAIELRFGVDFLTMTDPMTLVPPPRQWAPGICNMQGINYAHIRDAKPSAPVDGISWEEPPKDDAFADDYIGDYVTKLEDFVRSYSIDYPLKDGDDLAVISLGEDIFNVRNECTVPADNLLYYSTEPDKRSTRAVASDTQGWFVRGCGLHFEDEEGNPTREWQGCVIARPYVPANDVPAIGDPDAVLPDGAIVYELLNAGCSPVTDPQGNVTDPCPVIPSPQTGYTTVGAVAQRFTTEGPGYYKVSMFVREHSTSVAARVRIVEEDGSDQGTPVPGAEWQVYPGDPWERFDQEFFATGATTYRLEVYPSSTETALPATPESWPRMLVTGFQVEWVATRADGTPAEIRPWQRTTSERILPSNVCHTPPGAALRQLFTRKCDYICSNGMSDEPCNANNPAAAPTACYYEVTFPVSLEQIERGDLIPSGQIAIGNFNFRHYLTGVNLTGTSVTDCAGVQGSSCYNNGFVQYSLIHDGDVFVRNWEGGTLPAHMDAALIEHGKALATERTITNPPSSTDSQLLEPYMKQELKGRPIQGSYTLKIWDQPGLRWERIDDIQLVWKYHYWSRFSK